MKREELYMVETYKCEELKKRLKAITDWNEVNEGQLIFHENDNNIFNINKFSEYNKECNRVWYRITDNGISLLYDMSASGWYYYDESIADEVNEMFTPKLFSMKGSMVVAFNKQDALNELLETYPYLDLSDIEEVKEVDGFEIVLK